MERESIKEDKKQIYNNYNKVNNNYGIFIFPLIITHYIDISYSKNESTLHDIPQLPSELKFYPIIPSDQFTPYIANDNKKNIPKKLYKKRRFKRKYIKEEESSESESESDDEKAKLNSDERSYCVLVDNLNNECNKKKLTDIFGIAGNLKSVEIDYKNSKRYAIVNYRTEESAKQAILKLKDKTINGEKLELSLYKNPNELIIENLPPSVDIEYIRNILSVVGDTKSIVIQHSNNKNEISKAIIVFKERESIENAKDLLNDVVIGGLRIKLITNEDNNNNITQSHTLLPPSSITPSPPLLPNANKSNNKITNLSSTSLNTMNTTLIVKNLTRKEVIDVFNKYNIKSINTLVDENTYEVYFKNDYYTYQAYNDFLSKEYNHKIILLELGKRRRVNHTINTVFVGCLSESVKEEDLIKLFGGYGDIEAIKIFRSNNNRDYAYINFKDQKSVDEVVRILNGVNINGRYITVQYGKKKYI